MLRNSRAQENKQGRIAVKEDPENKLNYKALTPKILARRIGLEKNPENKLDCKDTSFTEICYLCGYALGKSSHKLDRDHVPPKRFFPKKIRKQKNTNLLTVPVHRECNISYQSDEDYFINSIAPLAGDTTCGKLVLEDLSRSFGRPAGKRLGESVLNEFEKRPSDLYLPKGKVAKRYNGTRVRRVLWKIIRGLFYIEYCRYLPENTKNCVDLIDDVNLVSDELNYVGSKPSRGAYPCVFDYRYRSFPEIGNFHLWVLLFWQKILIVAKFFDPDDNSGLQDD